MSKKVYKYSEIKDKIIHAIDTLAEPVIGTLSPMGANVICEDSNYNQFWTNDGYTIAKNISVSDEVENAIIEIIKHSSFKTNSEAGDGTTTSILYSQNLVKAGLKLIEDGWNPIKLKKEFDKFGEILKNRIAQNKYKILNDKDLLNIATISANNDTEVAKNIVKIIKVAGEDGMIFLEPNNKSTVEIIEDVGFHVQSGVVSPDLFSNKTTMSSVYENVPAIITDKRLYYSEESETILKAALEAGHTSLVIIARDFIGKSLDFFLANHTAGVIKLLLVKDPQCSDTSNESLVDLATYLGGKLISEKNGKIVNKITEKDFCLIKKIYSDRVKTIITPKNKTSKELADRITGLKKELEKNKENGVLKRRVSSLTNGMVTVKIGGHTPIEAQETMFRYEDAVNAVRVAIKDGYLVGGGTSILRAFNPKDYPQELVSTFKKYCEASVRQIAINCGKHPETVINTILESKDKNFGYNALTDKYENILKSGVIEPYKVTEMAIDNSISVANVIVSSKFLIINEKEDKGDK